MPPKKKFEKNQDNLFNWAETKSYKKLIKDEEEPYPYENTYIKINSRILCCGTTGSGKTYALLHYIRLMPNTFSKVIVYYKESENVYDYLKEQLKDRIEFHTSLNDLPTLKKLREDYDDKERILIVFDDYMMELARQKNPNINDYFMYGRKKRITLFLLSKESYTIPKVLRNQMTYLLLFEMNQKNDKQLIFNQFDTKDKIVEELYKDATSKKGHFLKIRMTTGPINEKYSEGFTNFYIIE